MNNKNNNKHKFYHKTKIPSLLNIKTKFNNNNNTKKQLQLI